MNTIWNVFFITLLSVSLLASSAVGETEARKYGQTLWRHIVTPGRYIVGYRFVVNRENGNVSEPLKYFAKHTGNSDSDCVIEIFYQANIPPETKTDVLSQLNIEAKSLDPESLSYVVYEYIEPFEVVFSKKKDIAGIPQLKTDVAGVDVKFFKIGETGSTEAYLLIMEAGSADLLKESYITREGQIISWKNFLPNSEVDANPVNRNYVSDQTVLALIIYKDLPV